MALSQDLISKFAKLTNTKKEDEGATLKGTYKKINGKEYVQLDGSDIWTPVESTVEAEDGEKVKVTIKDHAATIIGNISSPSARTKSVQDLKDEVDEFGNTIQQLDNTIIQQGNSIIQMNNTINQQGNAINQHNNAINQQGNAITQLDNSIKQQGNIISQQNNIINQHGDSITSMNNTITQQGNNINQMNNTIQQQGNTISQQNNIIEQQGNIIQQQGNTISQQGNQINQQGNIIDQQNNTIVEHGNNITILNSGFTIVDGVLRGLSSAIIDSLETNHLDARYANIDFSNIQMAAVTKLFTESGIIKDLVVQGGKITGELVGVTIKGDLIEANSLKADKLVVKGSDGLYYKLNIDGLDNVSTSQASKFILTSEKPSDWETNYNDYYIIKDNLYSHVKSLLPEEYEIIEYIKSDGHQLINTEYSNYNDNNNTYDISFMVDEFKGSFGFYGAPTMGLGNNRTSMLWSNQKSKLQISSGSTVSSDSQYNSTYNMSQKTRKIIKCYNNDKYYMIDDDLTHYSYAGSSKNENNIYIFSPTGNSNDSQNFIGKIYSFKLYQNDEIVRDFVPCKRLSDNEYGLYDLVNDVFYPNEGTGDFVPGPIMNQYPEWETNTYYKLNPDYESGLDGSNIVAQTITADKIAVTDLVAFGATIGGYNITQHSLYSGVKSSATNTTRGIYLGDDGQFAVGDANNLLRFYKDENDHYKLEIKANEIYMGTSNKTVREELDNIRDETTPLLQIESSRGTVFKNNAVSTVLSVAIYRGSDRITDMTTLRSKMGSTVYLQWKWKRLNDSDYGIISADDPRISQDGFIFTLSPQDVDTKVTFLCELIV